MTCAPLSTITDSARGKAEKAALILCAQISRVLLVAHSSSIDSRLSLGWRFLQGQRQPPRACPNPGAAVPIWRPASLRKWWRAGAFPDHHQPRIAAPTNSTIAPVDMLRKRNLLRDAEQPCDPRQYTADSIRELTTYKHKNGNYPIQK